MNVVPGSESKTLKVSSHDLVSVLNQCRWDAYVAYSTKTFCYGTDRFPVRKSQASYSKSLSLVFKMVKHTILVTKNIDDNFRIMVTDMTNILKLSIRSPISLLLATSI